MVTDVLLVTPQCTRSLPHGPGAATVRRPSGVVAAGWPRRVPGQVVSNEADSRVVGFPSLPDDGDVRVLTRGSPRVRVLPTDGTRVDGVVWLDDRTVLLSRVDDRTLACDTVGLSCHVVPGLGGAELPHSWR